MKHIINKWWLNLFDNEIIHLSWSFHPSTQWQTGFNQKLDTLLEIRIEILKNSDFVKEKPISLFDF